MRLVGYCSPAIRWVGLPDSIMVSVFPTARGEPLHNEEPVIAGQPRPLEPEEQRAGGRPRRRRDLGSRLQAQRQAQRLARSEVDENEEEVVIAGERGHILEGKRTGVGVRGAQQLGGRVGCEATLWEGCLGATG